MVKKKRGKTASDPERLVRKHAALVHADELKVNSHVQRDTGDWILNTLLIDGYDVPFRFKRRKKYRDLRGAMVNITYYPRMEDVAGVEFEIMHVVRIRKS